jgi:hypothetical protein
MPAQPRQGARIHGPLFIWENLAIAQIGWIDQWRSAYDVLFRVQLAAEWAGLQRMRKMP